MKDQHKQSDSLTASRRNPTSRRALPRLTLRIDFDAGRAVGPGKIKLMELIDKHVDAVSGDFGHPASARVQFQRPLGAEPVSSAVCGDPWL
jgi:hypothetical protein